MENETLGRKLYVGNLPYPTTEQDLTDLFSQAGTVEESSIIRYRDTQRSKGFGFVTMATAEEAAEAVTKFNKFQFAVNGGEPRELTVNEARPREERPAEGAPATEAAVEAPAAE